MRLVFTILIVCFLGIVAKAQQPSQHSLYMLNPFKFNPAYAGLDHSLSATGVYRRQWVDLPESPTTQNLNFHLPLYFLGGAVGANFENDALGAERTTSVTMAYAFQRPVGNGLLSLALEGGLVQKSIDGSKLRTPDGIYEDGTIIQHNDDILPTTLESGSAPTFHAGIYFQSEKFEAGLSAQNLSEASVELTALSFQLVRTYYANFGFNFDLSNSVSIHPSALIRSDVTQTQTDLSLIFRYNDNIFGGTSFRGYNSNSIDAVSLIAGFNINEHFTVGYAYDITLSELSNVSNGSHEVIIKYNLNKRIGGGRPPRIIYNPRSL